MRARAGGRLRALALAAAVLVSVGGAAAACGKCGEESRGDDAGAAFVLPPVAAPDALLADVYVGSPNASWGKLQRGVGGAVGILPASAPGIVCAMFGLDPGVAAEVDGTAPIYAVLAGDPAAPSWLVAMKLLDPRKARALLVDGDTARFSGRDLAGMTELVAKGPTSAPQASVALTSNAYLVLAKKSDDLVRLAPYATRTLPSRPVPTTGSLVADVPQAALTKVLQPRLVDMWSAAKDYLLSSDQRMRAEHGGRAPDYGDPKAIVAALDGFATKRIAVVGDLETMRIAVDVQDDGLAIHATMKPANGGGPATKWTDGMTVGDTSPVAAFPATSALVLSMRDREEDRKEQAADVEKAITSALGPRLAEPDAKKLHDTIDDWTKARGDTTTAALAWDEPQGLVLRTAARDGDAASRAMKGAVELARAAPFKDILRVKDVTSSADEVPGVGKATLAVLLREPPKEPKPGEAKKRDATPRRPEPAPSSAADGGAAAAAPPPSKAPKKDELALAWIVDGGQLSVASGAEALATLRGSVRPDRKLSDEPAITRALTALRSDASTILVAQPLRFDPARANLPAAPLVVGLGRREKEAFLRIDVSHGLLRELARWQMGL